MNRKEEAVLLNIKFHREKKNGADDGERQRENILYKVFSLVPRCGCRSARRALMMSLRLNVEALDRWEPQDSQRGRRPSPINDAAPLSSFHTKTDGLRERKREREKSKLSTEPVCATILGCLQKHRKKEKIHLQWPSILKGSIHYRRQTCCVRIGWGVNITRTTSVTQFSSSTRNEWAGTTFIKRQ